MAWPEREEQVERFRDPSGTRFLVATDAAGEGINLQFCRQMVNYDIPWNPARLEQRMGRIHRYRQRHDVWIVNLVSTDTREGRVLKVLLDKLEAIRRELRSDKVFDVIGRLFENRSLRWHMSDALTDEGERRARRRLEAGLTSEVVRKPHRLDEQRYGRRGDVARRLGTLRHEMERERYLHLLPANVRRFVELASPLRGLAVRGELDGFFSLVLPPTGEDAERAFEAQVEEIAMGIAAEWERARGASVQDVSRPPGARAAGLPDHLGFDLLSESADGRRRHIEVKGRAGRGEIWMEENEWRQACQLGDEYWLYVVYQCATGEPELVRIRHPFCWRRAARVRITVGEVMGAAEGDG